MKKKWSHQGAGATDTLIGEGTIIEGKIVSQASIRVEGQVHGDIECAGDIDIGKKALLQSDITAREVTIAGIVQGNVHAQGKLIITATGQLTGGIQVGSLTIIEGGIFQGTSRMELRQHEQESQSEPLSTKQEQKRGKHKNEATAIAN